MPETGHLTFLYDEPGPPGPVSRETFRRWVGSLAALGWPAAHIRADAGCEESIYALTQYNTVPAEPAEAVRELFLDRRDQIPAPRPGLSRDQIRWARNYARSNGWLTPDWYTAEGAVFTFTEHLYRRGAAVKQAAAYEGVEVLRLVVNGFTTDQIAERISCAHHHVQYWREGRAGLRGRNSGDRWEPYPEHRARLREIEAALDRYLADPDADPYIELCKAGVMHKRGIEYYCKIVGQPVPDMFKKTEDTAVEKIAS